MSIIRSKALDNEIYLYDAQRQENVLEMYLSHDSTKPDIITLAIISSEHFPEPINWIMNLEQVRTGTNGEHRLDQDIITRINPQNNTYHFILSNGNEVFEVILDLDDVTEFVESINHHQKQALQENTTQMIQDVESFLKNQTND